jgi:hypothetical protein
VSCTLVRAIVSSILEADGGGGGGGGGRSDGGDGGGGGWVAGLIDEGPLSCEGGFVLSLKGSE